MQNLFYSWCEPYFDKIKIKFDIIDHRIIIEFIENKKSKLIDLDVPIEMTLEEFLRKWGMQ